MKSALSMMLAAADDGSDGGHLQRSRYVLQGLLREVEKIDRLLDIDDLRGQILMPANKTGSRRGEIDKTAERSLVLAARKQFIALRNVDALLSKTYQTAQRRMRALREKKHLCESLHRKRHYRLAFANNILMRSVDSELQTNGFFQGLDESDSG